MFFMIAVDCDGPACVVGEPGKSLSDSRDMIFARKQATRETDAAVRALFDSGAERVVVWDNHGFGANLVFDQLDRRCEVMLGTGFGQRFPKIDSSFAGVLMIGYHAMEGTQQAVLAHTYSPHAYRAIYVNEQKAGEIALDASVAGELNIPTIFLSSDDYGCKEARNFMPWIKNVSTKQGLGRNCAHSKHPLLAQDEIYESVCQAVNSLDEMQPFTFDHPLIVKIKFKKVIQAVKARIRRRGWQLTGPKTIKTTLSSMLDWRC